MMQTLNTAQMRITTEHRQMRAVDVREPDAYNGWPPEGAARGGHIPGALNLPASWTRYLDWPELVARKGITADSQLAVYGDVAANEAVLLALHHIGVQNVSVYPDFVREWLPRSELPLDRLARYQMLVPPAWLKKTLETRSDVVVCHCHYRNPDDYAAGHIPGAIALDTLLLENPETWNRRTPDELRRAVTDLGITRRTSAVLYGRDSAAEPDDPFPGAHAGQLAAMRCAFILLYCGVEDVRLLDGGMRAWQEARFEMATDASTPRPAGPFGGPLPARPELAVDMPEARKLIASTDGELVDIRSRAEFEGRVSGYNYIHRRGRIPGAVFAGSGSDAYHVESLRNPDFTVREADEIARAWRRAGLNPNQRLAFFCGTGWRASEAFIAAWLMGWPRPAVYDGGWFEWSHGATNPIRTSTRAA